jgi:hypothetical protein
MSSHINNHNPYEESRKRCAARILRAREVLRKLEYEAEEYRLGLPFNSSDEALAFLKMLTEVGIASGDYYCCEDDGWQVNATYVSRLLAVVESVIEYIVGYSIKHLDFYKDYEKEKLNMILRSSAD